MGIILAGSRTVWGLGAGLFLGELIWKNRLKFSKEIIGKILVAVGVIGMILGVINNDYQLSKFLGGWDSNGWEKRESLAVAAVRMIKESPLFGMGAGNFVVRLPEYQNSKFYWQQPVHNIFLLIWAEIGLLGVILLGINGRWLVVKVWQKKYWWWLVIIGVTGMVDHYWLTLPQNNWLLAVILGIM